MLSQSAKMITPYSHSACGGVPAIIQLQRLSFRLNSYSYRNAHAKLPFNVSNRDNSFKIIKVQIYRNLRFNIRRSAVEMRIVVSYPPDCGTRSYELVVRCTLYYLTFSCI